MICLFVVLRFFFKFRLFFRFGFLPIFLGVLSLTPWIFFFVGLQFCTEAFFLAFDPSLIGIVLSPSLLIDFQAFVDPFDCRFKITSLGIPRRQRAQDMCLFEFGDFSRFGCQFNRSFAVTHIIFWRRCQ